MKEAPQNTSVEEDDTEEPDYTANINRYVNLHIRDAMPLVMQIEESDE